MHVLARFVTVLMLNIACVLCVIAFSVIKILSFATAMSSDETHSLSLPDFPVDNLRAIVQILVICSRCLF